MGLWRFPHYRGSPVLPALLAGSTVVILVVLWFARALWVPVFSPPASREVLTIRYWTHADPNRTVLEEELIAAFEGRNPGIRVERRTWDSQQISGTVQAAFAAQRGPDLFNLQIEHAAQYIDSGTVTPVDLAAFPYQTKEGVLEAYRPGVLDPVIRGDRIYGLPLELTNWALYLNRRIFREAGLDPDRDYPQTWEDVVAVSEQLVVREDRRPVRRGFDFRYTDYLIAVAPMVEQLGGVLVAEDLQDVIVGQDAWLTLLEFFREWGPAGRYLGTPYLENARSLFNLDNNEVAMAHTGLYQQGRMRVENPQFRESGDWMVVPFPQFHRDRPPVASRIYGHYMMVSSEAPPAVREAAWRLVAFFLDHAERYLEEVYIVQPTNALMDSDLYRSIPFSEVFLQDMERATVVYHGPHSAELQELLRRAVESVMFDEATAPQAYAALRAEARELFRIHQR